MSLPFFVSPLLHMHDNMYIICLGFFLFLLPLIYFTPRSETTKHKDHLVLFVMRHNIMHRFSCVSQFGKKKKRDRDQWQMTKAAYYKGAQILFMQTLWLSVLRNHGQKKKKNCPIKMEPCRNHNLRSLLHHFFFLWQFCYFSLSFGREETFFV